MTNPADSPGLQLWRVSNKWQRGLNRILSEWGITHTQYALLQTIYFLNESESRRAQTDIAKALDTDVMMVSQVLRQMELKNLVIRTRAAHDARVINIHMTDAATEIIGPVHELVQKYDRLFFREESGIVLSLVSKNRLEETPAEA
ncbi:MAG: MarR family transcriptional regulator [Fimbriimonadaceae bacterium]|jgi:DNA-binding MarR family transcriptional regulator|nr:MarR family transcriptional regulator [Fimbriimonadaceae bacterium]